MTDDLDLPAYAGLEPGELDVLIAALEPIAARLVAADSR